MAEATIISEDLAVKNGKAKIISISGQLDESNVDLKAKEIYKVLEETPGILYFIFDLQSLTYMNSKSVGYLTDWYGKITERGSKVYIARAPANIKDILQVVGLTQLIQSFDSLDEAKQRLIVDSEAGLTVSEAKPESLEPPAPAPVAAPVPAPVEPAPVATTEPVIKLVEDAAPASEGLPLVEKPMPTASVAQPESPAAQEPIAPATVPTDTFNIKQ
jgi:anti-anti-sigma factor